MYIPCIYAVNKVGAREGGGCPCLVGENNEGGAPRPSLNWLAVPLGPGFVLLRWPDALALCVLVHLSVHAAFSMHTAKWGPPDMLRPIPMCGCALSSCVRQIDQITLEELNVLDRLPVRELSCLPAGWGGLSCLPVSCLPASH